eukprot:scaffold117648_cov14-Tisochrysis_lutea.AAC.1
MQTLSACKPGALLSSSLPLQGPKPHVVGLGGHRRAQTRLPPPQALELASLCEQSFQIPAAAALVLPVMGLAGCVFILRGMLALWACLFCKLPDLVPQGRRITEDLLVCSFSFSLTRK